MTICGFPRTWWSYDQLAKHGCTIVVFDSVKAGPSATDGLAIGSEEDCSFELDTLSPRSMNHVQIYGCGHEIGPSCGITVGSAFLLFNAPEGLQRFLTEHKIKAQL